MEAGATSDAMVAPLRFWLARMPETPGPGWVCHVGARPKLGAHWEVVEVVPASRLAEVEAAHQARFALITKHYAELAAERDRLRAPLAYLADEESWIGGVQDEPLVYGHDQPWEIARVALNPPKP